MFPCEGGRSVRKSTDRCDHGHCGTGKDVRVQLPHYRRHQAGGREYGSGIHGPLLCVIQPGQCVGLSVLGTWSVRKGENKTDEKHVPPCLVRVQSPLSPDVLQIAVVSSDEKRVFSPLKPMSPSLQSLDDSQQLPVPHVIVSLCRAELPREESTGRSFGGVPER